MKPGRTNDAAHIGRSTRLVSCCSQPACSKSPTRQRSRVKDALIYSTHYPALFNKRSTVTDLASRLHFKRLAAPGEARSIASTSTSTPYLLRRSEAPSRSMLARGFESAQGRSNVFQDRVLGLLIDLHGMESVFSNQHRLLGKDTRHRALP